MTWECNKGHQWSSSFGHIKNSNSWCPVCSRKIKYTIEQCKEYTENKGGKCLSEEYVNSSTKMKWECKEWHQWDNSFGHINSGQWCPWCCSNKYNNNIELCKEYAENKGGKCLQK